MSLPVIINPLAELDIAEARLWYESQREGLGDEFLDCLDESLELIRRMPEVHARVFQELRRTFIRRFPYGVFYRIDSDQITVVAVYHGRRHPRGWQSRA